MSQDDNGSTPLQGLPDGVQAHESVDLTLADPALGEDGKRRCVTSRQDGQRCGTVAVSGLLLCSLHSGRLDAAAGGKARARALRERRDKAEREAAARALGTRALVAQVFAEKAEQVELALGHLLTAASGGDLKSAQALLPWLNQALGMPTERVEQLPPVTPADIEQLDTRTLEALVRRGRERALRAAS